MRGTRELEVEAEHLLRRVAADRLPVDAGAVAKMLGLIRQAHEAGRQSVRDDQERMAEQIRAELDAEEDPAEGTAGWLRDFLTAVPRDRKVILQKDAEGNGYSPLSDAGEGMYLAGTTWSGEMYATPEDIAADAAFTEDDAAPDDAERVVVLWPVN